MRTNDITTIVEGFISDSPHNYISKDVALRPKYINMKIFEAPLTAFGAAEDELFNKYKSSNIIGSHFLTPIEWLPGAKTVISIFFPYSDEIKAANSLDCSWPAEEWLHGRIEGQLCIRLLLDNLVKTISEAGFKSLAPSLDERYHIGGQPNEVSGSEDVSKFASNWSERHVAYACGLGTFGLSKGIITKKGMAGRFGSIVTELDLPKDVREYSEVYEYCTMCGGCINRCPVQAITIEGGKRSATCGDFLDKVRENHKPRYGCGKCQVSVPCASEIPVK